MLKSFICKMAEKKGHDGKSFEAGWFHALMIDESDEKNIWDADVYIIPLECKGKIVGIFMGRTYGIEYKVRYYIDGKQYEQYFFRHELDEVK